VFMPGSSVPHQLALALAHGESFAREDFLAGPSNAAPLAWIERWPDWPDRVLALVGPAGSGKSHLAAIWAERTGARLLSSRALDDPSLPGALATGALVLEDVRAGAFEEAALFHLLNLVREEQGYLLLTSRAAPVAWPVRIPDLASRLRALPLAELGSPDDALLRAVLVKLFADRQLAVDENLVGYLAARIERSVPAARAAVAALDQASLRLQRPVNRALAAATLRGLEP
jgi:chromosomal replication initiation ATPase DnaA